MVWEQRKIVPTDQNDSAFENRMIISRVYQINSLFSLLRYQSNYQELHFCCKGEKIVFSTEKCTHLSNMAVLKVRKISNCLIEHHSSPSPFWWPTIAPTNHLARNFMTPWKIGTKNGIHISRHKHYHIIIFWNFGKLWNIVLIKKD